MRIRVLIFNNFFADPTERNFTPATGHFITPAYLFTRCFTGWTRPELHGFPRRKILKNKFFLAFMFFICFFAAFEANRVFTACANNNARAATAWLHEDLVAVGHRTILSVLAD